MNINNAIFYFELSEFNWKDIKQIPYIKSCICIDNTFTIINYDKKIGNVCDVYNKLCYDIPAKITRSICRIGNSHFIFKNIEIHHSTLIYYHYKINTNQSLWELSQSLDCWIDALERYTITE